MQQNRIIFQENKLMCRQNIHLVTYKYKNEVLKFGIVNDNCPVLGLGMYQIKFNFKNRFNKKE